MSELEALAPNGVRFRPFRGEEDYQAMGELVAKSWDADHVQWTITADDYRRRDEEPINQDPYRDRMMAEVNGTMVGFGEVTWVQITGGARVYKHIAHVAPEWRALGVRKALLRWNEARIRGIAASHPHDLPKSYETWADDGPNDWKTLVQAEGYEPAHHSLEMVRDDLENIPELPLPEGIRIRPVRPVDLRSVWELNKVAMRDHRNYSEDEFDDDHFEAALKMPLFDPNLWAVAWAGDKPVGAVWTYINEDENRQYHRKRGHTENIAVAREWRKKGIASALVAHSLNILKQCGMTSATLDVDAQNPSGALRVYRRLGFRTEHSFTFYSKPVP